MSGNEKIRLAIDGWMYPFDKFGYNVGPVIHPLFWEHSFDCLCALCFILLTLCAKSRSRFNQSSEREWLFLRLDDNITEISQPGWNTFVFAGN